MHLLFETQLTVYLGDGGVLSAHVIYTEGTLAHSLDLSTANNDACIPSISSRVMSPCNSEHALIITFAFAKSRSERSSSHEPSACDQNCDEKESSLYYQPNANIKLIVTLP